MLFCLMKKIALFEEQLDEIEGQIYIMCNKNEIGFVDESIPYEGEFLVTWLSLLNSGILHLDSYGYFAMLRPDSADVWLEFKLMNKVVQVSEIENLKEYENFIMTKFIENKKVFCQKILIKVSCFKKY